MDKSTTTGPDRSTIAKRFALTLGLVVAGAGVVMGGAFATFTNTSTTGSQVITSGTVALATGPTNDAATGASNIAAGDTIAREVDLNSTGATIADKQITLQVLSKTSPSPSLMETDATNGLQLKVDACSVAWTRNAGPPLTYTCGAVQTAVLASTSVSSLETTPVALPGLNSLSAGGQDYLVLTVSLPSGAPGDIGQHSTLCNGTAGGNASTENLEGCSSTLQYSFVAIQRNGTSQ